jgi:hypothetical protein
VPSDDLRSYIFSNARHPLALRFEEWLRASSRFRVFVFTYRDKIRKKVRSAGDDGAYSDLQAELEAAYYLIQERSFAVEYEKYSAGKQRGPDFTVTFRTHTPFNVEVTRLRGARPAGEVEPHKIANILCTKLGQLPAGIGNVLFLSAEDPMYTAGDLNAAARLLQDRYERKDDPYFVGRGFLSSRDFLRQYSRLSGVRLITSGATGALWLSPQARHVLMPEIANILRK